MAKTTFEYDKLGRVTKKWSSLSGAVYFAYDAAGRRTSLKDPDLNESVYVYDQVGRLEKIELAAGKTAYFAHDASGLRTRKIAPDNLNMAYMEYDAAGRLSSLENRSLLYPFVVTSFDYTRDQNGQITRIDHYNGDSTYYQYDALNRVAREHREPSFSTAFEYDLDYSYDAASNRTARIDQTNAENVYFQHDSRNLVTRQWNQTTGATSYFSYDSSQRLVAKKVTGSDQSSYFTHDQRDLVTGIQFAKASGPDGDLVFGYSGLGERVVLASGGTPTYLAYDGSKLLREGDTGGSALRTYRHNAAEAGTQGSAIQLEAGGQVYGYGFDQRGTTANETFDIGEPLTDQVVYDVSGNRIGAQEYVGLDQRLTFVSPGLADLLLGNQTSYGGALGSVWLPEIARMTVPWVPLPQGLKEPELAPAEPRPTVPWWDVEPHVVIDGTPRGGLWGGASRGGLAIPVSSGFAAGLFLRLLRHLRREIAVAAWRM